MTQYIIEYMGGTKGDLLCRFLNGFDPDISSQRSNVTIPPDIGCINWLRLANPYHLTLDRFEEVLVTNSHKFLSAHPLWVTYNKKYLELLDTHDYKIIKLRFEKKHYTTISIESNLKNRGGFVDQDGAAVPRNLIFLQIQTMVQNLRFQGLDWDTFLTSDLNTIGRRDNKNAWNQRSYLFELFLSGNNENREFISYSDLYLNFNCDILNGYDLDEWKFLVRSSWCDYKDDGYMDWDRPYPETIPTTKHSDVIEKWIKENE